MGVGTLILTVVGSVLAAAICYEAKAWTPRIIAAGLALAHRCLPDDEKWRHEEWRSHIESTPGYIAKIFAVLGMIIASKRIFNESSRKSSRRFLFLKCIFKITYPVAQRLAATEYVLLFYIFSRCNIHTFRDGELKNGIKGIMEITFDDFWNYIVKKYSLR